MHQTMHALEATVRDRERQGSDERYRLLRKLTVWFEYSPRDGSAASLQILFFLSCVLLCGSAA